MTSQAKMPERGQPSVTSAGPSKPTVNNDEPFRNVTRDNGIAFRAADNVSVQTYIDAITEDFPPEYIVSASRISNGRIAIYLSSRQAVINTVQQGLSFDGSFLELTPLVRPTTRLTLSNVYPEIPNGVIAANLSAFCKVVSQIKPIPLGLKRTNLTHIMSFRRQVQVLLNPNVTPPDHINFTFSGTNYRVFISTESVRCFSCGELGHISRSCKKQKSARKDDNPSSDSESDNEDDNRPPTNPLNPPVVFMNSNRKSDSNHRTNG